MGKNKQNKSTLRKNWIEELKVKSVMQIDGAKIICLACQKGYSFTMKSEVEQHINTAKHKTAAKIFGSRPERQILLSEAVSNDTNRSFNRDLCEAFVSAGIPWNKLNNASLRGFLQKYTGKEIPDESTLRKNYLPKIYAESLEEIRREIGIHPIWLSIDETTDKCGRYIANVLVGALKKSESSKPHLISSKVLEKTNNATVTKAVLDALQLLWPGHKQKDVEQKFLLFLTDGVEYMLKAGKNLKNTYEKLQHVTCIAHGINRVAEEIRSLYPQVDKLISCMKAAFKKAPSRVAVYRKMCPELPLPPEPVLTRWGTWLTAAEFYALNFHEVKPIVLALENDSAAVNSLKNIIDSTELPKQLSLLSSNYTFLSGIMKEVQEQGASLKQSLQYLDTIEDKIFCIKSDVGKKVIQKFKSVIGKNPDLETLKSISSILEDNDEDIQLPEVLNPADIAAFKYAPVTSVDAERSFSMHKFLLSDRRRRLTADNLEMELVSHFELAMKP